MDASRLPEVLRLFADTYARLGGHTVSQMEKLYDRNVVFRDPVHGIRGLLPLQDYMKGLVAGVHSCRFDCHEWIVDADRACVLWDMQLRHPSLRSGERITVRGMSRLHFGEQILLHEDAYDLGAMLYEHVPLMGHGIRWLKQRLAAAS